MALVNLPSNVKMTTSRLVSLSAASPCWQFLTKYHQSVVALFSWMTHNNNNHTNIYTKKSK